MKPKPNDEKFKQMATKISPAAAEVWDSICQALQTDTYHLLQAFIYTMIRAASDAHGLNADIQRLLTILELDSGWQNAFNSCSPNGRLKIAQVVLILEQEGKKGFGAVMVDKPFMGEAVMTECVDDILERVTEVTMHGIYRRLREVGVQLECNNLSDVLLTLIERHNDSNEFDGPSVGYYAENNRELAYGKKTKSLHHRTPDGEAMRQQRIVFTDDDRDQSEAEARRDSYPEPPADW